MRLARYRLEDLTPAPYNPRRIRPEAKDGLTACIDRFGLVQPIVVNARSGRIVGGHKRYEVLVEKGEEETDVVLVDLDDADEKALCIALNSPEISGDFVTGNLESLIREIEGLIPETAAELRLSELAPPPSGGLPPFDPGPPLLESEVFVEIRLTSAAFAGEIAEALGEWSQRDGVAVDIS